MSTGPRRSGGDIGDDDGEQLIMNLEPDQLVLATVRPVPRAQLGHRAVLALWGLRVFSLLVSAMVIYAFIDAL
jgi:hypothetical protein